MIVMPKQINSPIKWKGQEVTCYYNSGLFVPKMQMKFYMSFIKTDTDYKVGDFAIIRRSNGQRIQQICMLKCLYEDSEGCKAVVLLYHFAFIFKEEFWRLNVKFDEDNEVVSTEVEEIISLKNIIRKCGIILGVRDESVSEAIDACNLNRSSYFLCRYRHTKSGNLVPVLNEAVKNDISIVEKMDEAEYTNSIRTPSHKASSNNSKPYFKKNFSESMETEDVLYVPQVAQVKRNLNNSFNDSLSQDDQSFLNYSIVEQPEKESLKLKLRVSNGKVLTSMKNTQPVVLLYQMNENKPLLEKESIFELKSPSFREVIGENEPNSSLEDGSKVVSYKELEPSEKPSKLSDLSNMVENLNINQKSPVQVSPRKLRRLSKPLYIENYSDSDSENYIGRRTSSRNKKQVRCRSHDTVQSLEEKNIHRSRKPIVYEISDVENETENIRSSSRIKCMRNIRKHVVYDISDDENEENHANVRRKSLRAVRQPSRFKMDFDESETNRTYDLRRKPKCKLDNGKSINISSDGELESNEAIISDTIKEDTPDIYSTPSSLRLDPVKKSMRLSECITPKRKNSNNSPKSTKKTTNNTPKSTKLVKKTPLKLIREGFLTPSIDQRKSSVQKTNTPLVLARNNLHVSYVPKTLPCREEEYSNVYNFIEGKLIEKCGGCMYISGVPGTGKTATVTAVIENLIKSWKKEGEPYFNYVCVNGMKLTEPRQCYVEIFKQLTGKRIPWEQALSNLEEIFTTRSSKKVVPTVLLVDELDILCTKRQDVVYNLLDWPTKTNAQLVVVTIANTMDLPERLLMSRVTSRLGLTRLTFQAYTHKQLQEIVVNRLTGNDSFKSDAIQFVARKVASVSGDARRALDICRRSAEIAESEGPNTRVSMNHVNAALDAMITQPKVTAISHCSRLEKLILQSVIAEVERTGIEEAVFGDVYAMLASLASIEGFKMTSVTSVSSAVYRLSSCRLLLADQKCTDFKQRIILNVSSDDVYYALKKD